ncbi:MAG TPA: DUF2490 domain-containing protein [Cytophagaceae bacterium]|nr:DUF2490 domain-containing protein [Cytophagaceae bacterium]
MNKIFCFVAILAIASPSAFGQHPGAQRDYIHNHMLWTNTQLMGKIKGKFNYSLDIEMRRQADPRSAYERGDKVGNDHFNIIKNPYQDALRPFIHYQPNDKVRFSWSPITWFGTWSFPINGKTTYQPEFRTSPQITFFSNLGRIQLVHRYRYEFRFYGVKKLDTHPGDPTGPADSYDFPGTGRMGRFRYMLRVFVPFNKTKIETGAWYLMTSSELFISTGKNVPSNKILDQNRFYFMIGYKFCPEFRLELGYLNQTAFRMNNKAKNNVDFNNNIAVNIIFDDFNSLFKKKKTE